MFAEPFERPRTGRSKSRDFNVCVCFSVCLSDLLCPCMSEWHGGILSLYRGNHGRCLPRCSNGKLLGVPTDLAWLRVCVCVCVCFTPYNYCYTYNYYVYYYDLFVYIYICTYIYIYISVYRSRCICSTSPSNLNLPSHFRATITSSTPPSAELI